MKKVKYYIFALIFLFSFILNVKAEANYSTYYSITIPEFESLDTTQQYQDMTKHEILEYFSNIDSEYFNIITMFENGNYVYLYLLPKNYSSIHYDMYGRYTANMRTSYLGLYNTDSNIPVKSVQLNVHSSYDFIDSTEYTTIMNCLNNNNCWSSYSQVGGNIYNVFTSISNNLISDMFSYADTTGIVNNNSYTIDSITLIKYFYSSQVSIFSNNTRTTPSGYYYKKPIINGIEVNSSTSYPTYKELYPIDLPVTNDFINYSTSLNTYYSNFLPSSFNNFNLSLNFKVPSSILGYSQDPQEYIDNTFFTAYCSGRINNTNYYSYESFPCSISYTSSISSDTISYSFSSLSTTSSLTNYDKVYLAIKTNYLDSNINSVVYGLSYTSSGFSIVNTEYKTSIYENFDNLPLNFKVYISSNNSLSNSDLFIKKYNFIDYGLYFRGYSNTSQQMNLFVGESILGDTLVTEENQGYIKLQSSNNIDTGILIYQYNSSIVLPKLELFLQPDFVLSINSTSNSTNFYYVDSNGDIVNSDFNVIFETKSNRYDISYYIGVVNDFIGDLSTDSLEIANLTQTFYNNMPLVFQSLIFVLFILGCIYFLYLLIKR